MSMDGIYMIENTVDELHTKISGYFPTEDEALDALKECEDWFRPKGTGRIYFREFGLNKTRRLVFSND